MSKLGQALPSPTTVKSPPQETGLLVDVFTERRRQAFVTASSLQSYQGSKELSPSLARNIRHLEDCRRREAQEATRQERLAMAITSFTGSMPFVYLHLALYGTWIVVNLGAAPGIEKFDPSFVMLAMVASVEAIFLSTFVLISQNRSAAAAEKRADLDLQISMLAEHELTSLVRMVADIAEHIGVEPREEILEEITRDVAPDTVMDEIEAQQQKK
jgi:uncharacterized membrane protein